MPLSLRSFVLISSLAAPFALAGCHVSGHKNANGGDNVNIDVPFASMHVKTDKEANTDAIGVATYPGAVPVKNHNDKDNDAADINMSFGDFHLGVKAASYQTSDAPSKVEAFYRKELAQYGEVIKCQGDQTVGQPTRTAQGLTCRDNDDNKHHGVHANFDNDSNPELRAGSPSHQHIVGMEAKNGGTRIGIVLLDLPKGLGKHTDADSE